MTQWHTRSRKKISGGIRTAVRRSDKKLAWKGRDFTATTLAEADEKEKKEEIVGRGNVVKIKLKRTRHASVFNPKTKKSEKAQILSVVDNPADRHYVRRNILSKGATIQVKIGGTEEYAKITNRPGQTGNVQAVLVEREEVEKQLKEAKEEEERLKKRKAEGKKKGKEKPKAELEAEAEDAAQAEGEKEGAAGEEKGGEAPAEEKEKEETPEPEEKEKAK